MTRAQAEALSRLGIDPWSLDWSTAQALGHPAFGLSEAAMLPDGRVLLANGSIKDAP